MRLEESFGLNAIAEAAEPEAPPWFTARAPLYVAAAVCREMMCLLRVYESAKPPPVLCLELRICSEPVSRPETNDTKRVSQITLTNNPRNAVHRPPRCLVPPLGLRPRRQRRRREKILADGPGAAGLDPALRS